MFLRVADQQPQVTNRNTRKFAKSGVPNTRILNIYFNPNMDAKLPAKIDSKVESGSISRPIFCSFLEQALWKITFEIF